MGLYVYRLFGAAVLDASIYEGIEADPSANRLALATWVAWALLVFQIGGRMMPAPETRTSVSELMRTIGFAAAPGLLQVFAVFPRMTVPVFAAAWLWIFAATVTAVRHALDYESLPRTLVVCALAAAMPVAMAIVLGVMFGPTVS